MATPITSTQGVQGGGIGSQSIVSAPTPSFSSAVRSVGADLGAIKSLTEDSVRREGEEVAAGAVKDVETALGSLQEAEAERDAGPFREQDIAALESPGKDALGEADFELLRKGVNSGKISKETAHLFAANQVTKRVQEQPIFAERIREAASRVIGFDPKSLQVQTALGLLGSTAEKGNTALTFGEKKLQEAQFQASVRGTTVEQELTKISDSIEAGRAAQTAQDDYNLGAITLEENLGKQVNKISTDVLDSIQAQLQVSVESGIPVDATAIAGSIEAAKLQSANELRAAAGNKANSSATLEAIKQSDKIYDSWKNYSEIVGVDNLTQVKLDRAKRFQDLHGVETFGQFRVLREQFGDRAVDRLMDLALTYNDKPELFQQRLNLFPKSKEILELFNGDAKAYTQAKWQTMTAMSEGKPLTAIQQQLVPDVIDEVTKLPNGNRDGDSTESIVKGLGGNGDAMTSSMIAKVPVIDAGNASKTELKRAYNEDRQPYIRAAAAWIGNDKNRGFTFDNKGNLVLTFDGSPSPSQGAFDVQERVNIFNNALDRGWGSTLNSSREQYRAEIEGVLGRHVAGASDRRVAGLLTQVTSQLQQGNEQEAAKLYRQAAKLDPTNIVVDFSQVKEELKQATSPFLTTPSLTVNETPRPVGEGSVLADPFLTGLEAAAKKAGVAEDRLKIVMDEAVRRKEAADLEGVLTSGGLGNDLF